MANFVKMALPHIEQIEAIEKEAFKTPWSLDMLLEELDNPLANYFVIEEDGKVKAYGGYLKILDEGHIMNIAVEKDCRRQGLGNALLSYMIDRMASEHITAVTLEVNEHNLPAISLYESFGFILAGKRPKYYEGVDTALIYWKTLEE